MKRLFLILVAFFVVAGIVLAAVGVLSIQNSPDKTSITIDKAALREKTQKALHETKKNRKRDPGKIRQRIAQGRRKSGQVAAGSARAGEIR